MLCLSTIGLCELFETLTQWLNLLGSVLTLRWFRSEGAASSDFNNVLYALIVRSLRDEPQTSTIHRDPRTHSHICVHKQLWPHPNALYQHFLDELCLHKTDRLLPASQTVSLITHTEREREKVKNFGHQRCYFIVEKGLCHRWRALLLLVTHVKSLWNPLICSVTNMLSPKSGLCGEDCLERGVYFQDDFILAVSCQTSVFVSL